MSADDGKVKSHRPIMATIIRRGAVFIILGWLAITVLLTVKVPPLEIVEREHSVSLSPPDAPSVKAMTQMGKVFQESNSESVAVIVLEGEGTLGDDAHKYYDAVIRQLKDDPKHVQHVQDFWGDPLTAGAAQSADGKAAYVQLNLTGRFGQADANESVEAVQKVVRETPGLPPGVKAYVTGPAAIVSDMAESGNRTVILITLVSVGVIFLMLLLLYRSIITVIILLFTVGIELQVARGLVAFLGIPICWSIRSIFDALDGVDQVTDKMQTLVGDLDELDKLMPQLLEQFPIMIETMKSTRESMLTMHSTMSGIFAQMDESTENSTAMGKAFDASKNDDSFYLPPDVLKNKDFQRVMKIFMSPDGKSSRMLISQRGDPATPEGISRVEPIKTAAEEALKGTPLEHAKLSLAGTAAGVSELVEGSKYDLLIAGVAALCLIFIIMLLMTRSLVAALVIVGTVALSLGASFGLSVLVWQHICGIQINWVVLAMSVIVLLAVGSDYNLLLVSRMKEELGAGLKTGIIRAMGGTGKVVTAAGLVFAATMGSMIVSDLLTIGQVGTTIGLGLLFDTLIVRAFMTPAIAALLGRWFWWPLQVSPRPVGAVRGWRGPRLVRSVLQRN
ncbi:hypothetical protein A3N98_21525 [Mycobacteroides abscessus]|nr:MMPL family transporter [Mycobacteroides abscessus]AMU37480.1 hypothetical protein A3N98_21525 [Mycobacteroides abscessus]